MSSYTKSYWPKDQPLHASLRSFYDGVRQSRRAIALYLSGREEELRFKRKAPRAQKGYLRISLTRFASCIAPTSPAITAAQRVTSACAPEIWRTVSLLPVAIIKLEKCTGTNISLHILQSPLSRTKPLATRRSALPAFSAGGSSFRQ